MLNTAYECRDTAKLVTERARKGPNAYRRVMEDIHALRRAGEIGANLSFRNLYEFLVPDGYEALRAMEHRVRGGGGVVMEAGGDAVMTSHFSNIIGQITYADTLNNFEAAEFIGDRLVTQIPATTGQREIVPGVTMIGDQADFVGEGEEYPTVGIGEQFIMLPEVLKNGFTLNITEEIIFEDKTGLVMQNFNKATESMAITQEKERLSVALGVTNTYSRNGGPQQSTYANTHTQGDFDNLIASNPLVDKTSLSVAKNAFNDIIDPETGEPIMLGTKYQIVVPDPLEWTLGDILGAKEYRSQPTRGSSATMMISGNPINMGGRTYEPLSNQYVSSIVGSDTSWFMGAFAKAFVERVIYPTQIRVQDHTGPAAFERDIVTRINCRRRTRAAVKEPRYAQKHTA